MGALDASAKRLHWRLVSWTKSACPVADISLRNPTLNRPYVECDAWRAAVLDRIRAMHPQLVVASQSDAVPGGTVATDDWAAATGRTLALLTSNSDHVVFLADTPYPKGDAPSCVATHLEQVQQCAVPRAEAYHDTSYGSIPLLSARHDVVSKVLESQGVSVLDPVNWLCDTSLCPAVVGNVQVYRDKSHMTNTYSTKLAPILEPIFGMPGTTSSNSGEAG
jgi:hypothetical protein